MLYDVLSLLSGLLQGSVLSRLVLTIYICSLGFIAQLDGCLCRCHITLDIIESQNDRMPMDCSKSYRIKRY